jgi:uncharacterized coiled-coil protein SlyX
MGAEAVSLVIAAAGVLLAALGFYTTSRRSSTSVYTHELEKTIELRDKQIAGLKEDVTLLRHDLDRAERRIEALLDRLGKNGHDS